MNDILEGHHGSLSPIQASPTKRRLFFLCSKYLIAINNPTITLITTKKILEIPLTIKRGATSIFLYPFTFYKLHDNSII